MGRGRSEVEDEATGWSSFINLEGLRQSDFMRRGGIGGGRTPASAVLVDICCCSRLSVVDDGVTNRCGGCGWVLAASMGGKVTVLGRRASVHGLFRGCRGKVGRGINTAAGR